MFNLKNKLRVLCLLFLFLQFFVSIPQQSVAQVPQTDNRYEKLFDITQKVHANGALQFKQEAQISEAEIIAMLSDNEYTFELVRENKSLKSESINFKMYQEYYKDYKVEGSAFTLKIRDTQKN